MVTTYTVDLPKSVAQKIILTSMSGHEGDKNIKRLKTDGNLATLCRFIDPRLYAVATTVLLASSRQKKIRCGVGTFKPIGVSLCDRISGFALSRYFLARKNPG